MKKEEVIKTWNWRMKFAYGFAILSATASTIYSIKTKSTEEQVLGILFAIAVLSVSTALKNVAIKRAE